MEYTIPKEDPKFKIIERRHNSKRVDIGAQEDELDFELEHVAPAVANLFRRTMMRDVPTVAIDVVVFRVNDGVLFDEALAHRLGLVPLAVDAEGLGWCEPSAVDWVRPDPKQVLKFELRVRATCDNFPVYSSHLEWKPLPGQEQDWQARPPKPVHKKILLAKLGKDQSIVADCFAIKGTGALHTKWSPVACCSYKPMPVVRLPQPVRDDEARQLRKLCPRDVFDIEDSALVVRRERACTMCRDCIRSDRERGSLTGPIPRVDLRLKKDHFLFQVESTGVYPSHEIFTRAMRAFGEKVRVLAKEVEHAWPHDMQEDCDPAKEDYL